MEAEQRFLLGCCLAASCRYKTAYPAGNGIATLNPFVGKDYAHRRFSSWYINALQDERLTLTRQSRRTSLAALVQNLLVAKSHYQRSAATRRADGVNLLAKGMAGRDPVVQARMDCMGVIDMAQWAKKCMTVMSPASGDLHLTTRCRQRLRTGSAKTDAVWWKTLVCRVRTGGRPEA
jgi:hypothetical protein